MSGEKVVYRHDSSVRVAAIVFCVIAGCTWFACVGYGITLRHETVTVSAVIVTVLTVILVSPALAAIIRGGRSYFEITDEAVLWGGPFQKSKRICHNEVESFVIVEGYIARGANRMYVVKLLSGNVESFRGGLTGDDVRVQGILMRRWLYLGTRPDHWWGVGV